MAAHFPLVGSWAPRACVGSLLSYNLSMGEVRKTLEFQEWFDGLKDARAYAALKHEYFASPSGFPAT